MEESPFNIINQETVDKVLFRLLHDKNYYRELKGEVERNEELNRTYRTLRNPNFGAIFTLACLKEEYEIPPIKPGVRKQVEEEVSSYKLEGTCLMLDALADEGQRAYSNCLRKMEDRDILGGLKFFRTIEDQLFNDK